MHDPFCRDLSEFFKKCSFVVRFCPAEIIFLASIPKEIDNNFNGFYC